MKNKGFSLVELIVVIAIMAILVGVAVPVYSSYVEKAQKASDIQMVDEIKHALQVYYASNPTDFEGGYVVLKPNDGAEASSALVDVMEKTFGNDWQEELALAYGGWTGAAGMLKVLSGYNSEQLTLINSSSYLTYSNTEGLLGAVDKVLDAASAVITRSDPAKRKQYLRAILPAENAEHIISTLESQGLMDDPNAISNMLVGAMADTLENNEALTTIMNDYAAAFTYAEKTGDRAALDKMTENLGGVSVGLLSGGTEDDALDVLYAGFAGVEEYKDFDKYITDAADDGSLKKDQDALKVMMGAVKEIAGNFEDADSLKNGDLYLSGDVFGHVDNYLNAVDTLGTLSVSDLEFLKNLPDNAVAIFISASGVVSVYPVNLLA